MRLLHLLICLMALAGSPSWAQANLKIYNFMRTTKISVDVIQATVPFKPGILSREQQVKIHGSLFVPQNDELIGTTFKSPFPLAVFSHGTHGGGPRSWDGGPSVDTENNPAVLALLQSGYAVFQPIRKGRNSIHLLETSPVSPEDAEPTKGPCSESRDQEALDSAVADTTALMGALKAAGMTAIDFSQVIFVGHGRGSVVSLELASRGFPGLVAVLNFVGGWHSEPCGSFSVKKMEEFGSRVKIPVYSFYGDQDRSYPISTVERFLVSLSRNPMGRSIVYKGLNNDLLYKPSAWWDDLQPVIRRP
jgi:dienelactone hydrolase